MNREEYAALIPGDFVTYLGGDSFAMRSGTVARIDIPVVTVPPGTTMAMPALITFTSPLVGSPRFGQNDGTYDMKHFRSPYRKPFTTVDQADLWLDANAPRPTVDLEF